MIAAGPAEDEGIGVEVAVGGLLLPLALPPRNATNCMTQNVPFCAAVALYEPAAVTLWSCVRLPKAAERVA